MGPQGRTKCIHTRPINIGNFVFERLVRDSPRRELRDALCFLLFIALDVEQTEFKVMGPVVYIRLTVSLFPCRCTRVG